MNKYSFIYWFIIYPIFICLYIFFFLLFSGRVHSAIVSGVNWDQRSVTVEWFEKGETKGKEVNYNIINYFSPHLIGQLFSSFFSFNLCFYIFQTYFDLECFNFHTFFFCLFLENFVRSRSWLFRAIFTRQSILCNAKSPTCNSY